MIPIWTTDPVKNKRVMAGWIEGVTYVKTVIPEKHFFRQFGAYAIQEDIFPQLQEHGVTDVMIRSDKETLMSPLSKWLEMKPMNKGGGEQRFLTLKHMERKDSK